MWFKQKQFYVITADSLLTGNCGGNKTRVYLQLLSLWSPQQNYEPRSLVLQPERKERMIAESLTICYHSTVSTVTVTFSGMREPFASLGTC